MHACLYNSLDAHLQDAQCITDYKIPSDVTDMHSFHERDSFQRRDQILASKERERSWGSERDSSPSNHVHSIWCRSQVTALFCLSKERETLLWQEISDLLLQSLFPKRLFSSLSSPKRRCVERERHDDIGERFFECLCHALFMWTVFSLEFLSLGVLLQYWGNKPYLRVKEESVSSPLSLQTSLTPKLLLYNNSSFLLLFVVFEKVCHPFVPNVTLW
jgi:hypothetical protein